MESTCWWCWCWCWLLSIDLLSLDVMLWKRSRHILKIAHTSKVPCASSCWKTAILMIIQFNFINQWSLTCSTKTRKMVSCKQPLQNLGTHFIIGFSNSLARLIVNCVEQLGLMMIIPAWQSNFSSWHLSYFTGSDPGTQDEMLLQALPTWTVKLLDTFHECVCPRTHTHTRMHTHIKWKSKAIPPQIKLRRWSNGLSWWQGTIISSKEVKAADYRLKNVVQSRVGDGKRGETPRHWLQFSIYDKLKSLSSLFYLLYPVPARSTYCGEEWWSARRRTSSGHNSLKRSSREEEGGKGKI